jgi:hypothetical protein
MKIRKMMSLTLIKIKLKIFGFANLERTPTEEMVLL